MDEREKTVVAGVAVLGGLGLAMYLLRKKPKPKWLEVTGFEIKSAEE